MKKSAQKGGETMSTKDIPYRIVAVKEDGEREVISTFPYTSRGHCFASASKAAVNIKVIGNPDKIDRLELENVRGEPLEEYNGHEYLCIATA